MWASGGLGVLARVWEWMVGLEIGVQGALGTGSGTLHDVEIDHGGGDVGVTQKVLHGADVGTVFKEMGSEAVTKYMR